MPDYIPRSDALEAIEAERKAAHWTAQNEPSIESIHDECIITRTLERVEMRIRNIPPDSVKPVTHGEWVGNFPNPNYIPTMRGVLFAKMQGCDGRNTSRIAVQR